MTSVSQLGFSIPEDNPEVQSEMIASHVISAQQSPLLAARQYIKAGK